MIIVTKQLHYSNRLLVSLHYICVVCLLGHAVWNMIIQKCKLRRKCDGCSSCHRSWLDRIWERPRGDRVRVSQGSRIPLLCSGAVAFWGPPYDLIIPIQNMLMWCLWSKSTLLCINALTYAPTEAIFRKNMPCSYLVKGEIQILGSSLKGGSVHFISSGVNSSHILTVNLMYWIR